MVTKTAKIQISKKYVDTVRNFILAGTELPSDLDTCRKLGCKFDDGRYFWMNIDLMPELGQAGTVLSGISEDEESSLVEVPQKLEDDNDFIDADITGEYVYNVGDTTYVVVLEASEEVTTPPTAIVVLELDYTETDFKLPPKEELDKLQKCGGFWCVTLDQAQPRDNVHYAKMATVLDDLTYTIDEYVEISDGVHFNKVLTRDNADRVVEQDEYTVWITTYHNVEYQIMFYNNK